MTADQATADIQEPTGPEAVAAPPQPAWAGPPATPAEITGSLPAGFTVPAERAPSGGWAGAGGRWMIWVFRAVLWTVLLIIGYRGVAAIVTGQPVAGGTQAPAPAAAQAGPGAFPASLARAYALAFGQVYLNYSAAPASRRAAALAAFLPPGADPQLGWNGSGSQTLQFEQVAAVTVRDRHRAVVTLLARVDGRLIEVGVPVYATAAGIVVSGRPALLPPPSNIAVPASSAAAQDPAAKLALKRMLPGFFRAYATGNAVELARFSPRGTVITGLGSAVTFGGLAKLIVPAATGAVRHVLVTVSWRPAAAAGPAAPPGGSASPGATSPGPAAGQAGSANGKSGHPGRSASPAAHPAAPASVQMSYALTVVRQAGTWLVRSIGPAAAQPWPTP
ncbi:MAG TPA: conjugal transfer protein [Streptosporangiaceae bacterium]